MNVEKVERTKSSTAATHILAPELTADFSLLGGPLHELGRRLGLVRGTNTVRMGLAIGVGLWLAILAAGFMEGLAGQLFSLKLVGINARLLVVIPLFFLCETWVTPKMTSFVRMIVKSGVVPPGELPSLNAEVTRVKRLKDAWWPETVCLLVAVALAATRTALMNLGTSSDVDLARTGLAAFLYFDVSLTVFRFLVFLGVWRLAQWSWFLWRVSRLDLHLIPGHPDRDGGLGSVQGVQEKFVPLVAAISVLECAAMAEAISTGTFAIANAYPWLTLVLMLDAALFLGPLFVFIDKLEDGRSKGMRAYSSLAARYVTEFEAKWTTGNFPADERLLGTPDLQSLADLANSISVVRTMRWVTIGPRLLSRLTFAALAPLAPLLLFQYPLAELATKLFHHLVGL